MKLTARREDACGAAERWCTAGHSIGIARQQISGGESETQEKALLAQATTTPAELSTEPPVKPRGNRRAADIPLAGARKGDHRLWCQDQWQGK